MKSNYKFIPVVLSVLMSCAPTGKLSVTNVNDSGLEQAGRMIYALPQTVIDVYVEGEETVIIPGPYRQYAEKYLGIHNVPMKTESRWELKRVNISWHRESDPDYLFSVKGTRIPEAFPSLSGLISDSMILDLGKYQAGFVTNNTIPDVAEVPAFTDLSVKRNFEAEKTVEVSVVMPDSTLAGRQVNRKTLHEKTLEQKAEEAANFLIKLKKRRFKMVTGINDSTPQGESLADALDELSRLEEEYLSLFIGKRMTHHYQRSFHYTPVTGKEPERAVLFRFSDTQGFLEPAENGGKPVQLILTALGKTKSLEQSGSLSHLTDNMILYRVPDQVTLKLLFGEAPISEASFPVFQSGALVRMELEPVK